MRGSQVKVLWAYDPFGKNKKLSLIAKSFLTNLFDKKDSIEVAYVASNSEVELATAFNIPVNRRYSTYPKKIIKESLKKLGMKKIKIEVLFEESLSLTSAVKRVTAYTRKQKIDLILIATNSKKVLPRIIFGSFAETIVHLSNCDLLIFHQNTKINSKVPANLLYAYDFSAKGYLGLNRVIEYVKKWNSILTIVYLPIPEAGVSYQNFQEETQKKIKKLESHLERENINFFINMSYDFKPITETILNQATKVKADMIVTASKANRLEAFLGGSITRQILRESQLPTLVLKV